MPLIIGIDLGKHKSVACSHDTDTREAAYVTLATEPAAMRRPLESGRPGRPDGGGRAGVIAAFSTLRTGAWGEEPRADRAAGATGPTACL